LPPLSAEFQSALHPSIPGMPSLQHPWKLQRSSSGQTSVDQGNQSLITDPPGQRIISLDHVNKIATISPMTASPQQPQAPAISGFQAPSPQLPQMDVKDLGKRLMGGHEVEGKMYTFKPPQVPGAPPMPSAAQIPGAPAMPQAPETHLPQSMEVWTNPKLQLPMATRMNGSMGQQTTICKQATPGEPPPSAFQIPAGYKVVYAQNAHASTPPA
jgi:hypothetical protein